MGSSGVADVTPSYSDVTPDWDGFVSGSAPTGVTGRYSIIGNLMHMILYVTGNGTSNAPTMNIYMPTSISGWRFKNRIAFKTAQAFDNGTVAMQDANGQALPGGRSFVFFTSASGGTWTSSNGKRVTYEGLFEIESGVDLTTSPVRYASNPIIATPADFKNTCPSGMVTDPTDATKFLFYIGEFALGAGSVDGRIRCRQGAHSDYYSMPTDLGIVLIGDQTYDIKGCRFGQFITVGSEIWAYYVGIDASFKWRICLAKSSDGRTFTKQGVILDYNNTDEKSLSGPAIFRENGNWYMAYTVWDGVTANGVHNPGASKVGIKMATSTDGVNWTKTGTYILTIGTAGTYDAVNMEDCQLYKYGSTYVAIYNCKGASSDWVIGIASSSSITSAFTKNAAIYFAGSGASGTWDFQAVSTLYINPFNDTIGYYQGWDAAVTDTPIGAIKSYLR